ncbi:hypothetical protein NC651_033957 [Populus alba x Populus x berolinensis]|nr:hypothetical protein NC651_033957 [Populus alba x Populus x berolinensis]
MITMTKTRNNNNDDDRNDITKNSFANTFMGTESCKTTDSIFLHAHQAKAVKPIALMQWQIANLQGASSYVSSYGSEATVILVVLPPQARSIPQEHEKQ